MAESSAVPALHGLAFDACEWLPSGAESGLVRVRARWTDEAARERDLPVLVLHAAGADHRFDSLPDARFTRDPSTWRGTYLVPAELVASDPEAMWLEWPSGARSGLPALRRGLEPPPVPAAPERPEEPDEPGGQVIDRAVLAERRARRAEAAEQTQARVAAEALKAVEVLELRSAELERRLAEADTEARSASDAGRREALAAALASAAALRSRSREWQLRLRTNEVARAGDSVRLAVLEAERATGTEAIRAALQERGAELEAARRRLADQAKALASAGETAAAARAELEAATQAARREAETLQARAGALEAALATAEARIQTAEAALAAAEARLRVESVARSTLEHELDRERARAQTGFEAELEHAAMRGGFEAELERERAAMRTAFEADRSAARAAFEADHAAVRAALADAERRAAAAEASSAGERATVAELRAALEAERTEAELRIGELERRAAERSELERLAREQAAAAAPQPAGDPSRLVADLDAAAEALRRRTPEPADDPPPPEPGPPAPPEKPPPPVAGDEGEPDSPDDEPPAPDAEPAVDWGNQDEPDREPCVPGVQPVRPPAERDKPPPWTPRGFEPSDADEPAEPPAPDAEPGIEWAPPPEPPPDKAAAVAAPTPVETAAAVPPTTPDETATRSDTAAVVTEPDAAPTPTGPVIVPASRPPSRALVVGTNRREYPLLRGAMVKLAHDDPAAAARLLAALLPAQGVAIEGPLAYDVTIREAGTFGVAIAGGRASVERLDAPHPRSVAEFHLIGDALAIAELLAGVNHRIGRFFGPIRARGRKRRLKDLRPLTAGTISLEDAAKAGARLEPELVYRTLAYAVHPSWTRGHDFTIAQEITGDSPETWYLTARDGAGLTVSSTGDRDPDATVTMDREVFDRLLRGEPVRAGRRPGVHGDREAVEQMQAWTQRARGGLV